MNAIHQVLLVTGVLTCCGSCTRVSSDDKSLHAYQIIASTFPLGSEVKAVALRLPSMEPQMYCTSGGITVTEYQVSPGILVRMCFHHQTKVTVSDVQVTSTTRPIRRYEHVYKYDVQESEPAVQPGDPSEPVSNDSPSASSFPPAG